MVKFELSTKMIVTKERAAKIEQKSAIVTGLLIILLSVKEHLYSMRLCTGNLGCFKRDTFYQTARH